jgi:hypothetical protein
MTDLSDLNDQDFRKLANNLEQIINLSNRFMHAEHPSAMHYTMHQIYVLARDCRDLIMFDALSRETMHRLVQNPFPIVNGLQFNQAVISEIEAGHKIQAIKELRIATGCGLREAKDAVERYMMEHGV